MDKTTRVAPGIDGISRLIVEDVICPTGGRSQSLTYEEYGTFYYVMSGYGILEVDAYSYALSPEDAIYLPPGTTHALVNTGGVDLVIVRYGAPIAQ